jgi:hypothetical protein
MNRNAIKLNDVIHLPIPVVQNFIEIVHLPVNQAETAF